MSNAIDLVASKQALDGLDQLYQKLGLCHAEIIKINQLQLTLNAAPMAKTLADLKQATDSQANLTAEIQKQTQANSQLSRQIETQTRARKASGLSAREQTVANQILRAETDRNFRSTTLLNGAYARASAQLLILKKEAKDAFFQFGEGSKQFKVASAAASDLDQRLKQADKAVGDSQRNVGNYANGVAGGIRSVFGQIRALAYILPGIGMAGIFNLALEPLLELIKGLGIFNDKFLELRNNFDAFRESQSKIRNQTRAIKEDFESLYNLAKNPLAPPEESAAAIKKLRTEYRSFFQDYTDDAIKSGKAGEAFKKINESLAAKVIVENKDDFKKQTEERIDLLNKELDARTLYNAKRTKLGQEIEANTVIENAGTKAAKTRLTTEGEVAKRALAFLNDEEEARKKFLKDKKEENLLNLTDKQIKDILIVQNARRTRAQIDYNNALGKSLLLEKENNKKPKAENFEQAVLDARIRFLKELSEASRAEYEAEKSRRDIEISDLEKLAKDEKRTFEQRLASYGEMLKKKQELLLFSQNYELLAINQAQKEETAEAQKAYERELHQARGHAEAISKIKNYHSDELILMDQKYESQRANNKIKYDAEYTRIVEETSKAELEIINKKNEIIESTDKLYRDNQIKNFKSVADNEKLSVEVRQAAFNAQVALLRKQLDLDKLREESAHPELIDQIREKYRQLNMELSKVAENESPFAKQLQHANEELQSLLKNIQSGFLSGAGFGSLTQFFDGSFKNIMDGFDSIADKGERTLKKFQYTFQAIAEVAKDAFAYINKIQEQNFQKQYDRLDHEKEIAIQFAGESSTAKAEIERQYDQRRKKIQRDQARAEKENAIFSIAINTAQAIIATLAKTPPPAGIPLALIVGAIGAAELALVASRDIPQYQGGTMNAPEGWAIVDEARPEVHTDKKGNIVSTGSKKGANLRYMKEGDKVYKSHEDYLNGVLDRAGIMQLPNSGESATFYGATASEIREIMESTVGELQINNTGFDETGFFSYTEKRGQKTRNTNRRVEGKGRKV